MTSCDYANGRCEVPDGNRSRARAKGRAMAGDLGSKPMIRSPHWSAMKKAGVQIAAALPLGNPLLQPLTGSFDVRNHRKIVVIDGRITYCGSQNCADPEFRVKPKFAPWVDVMTRLEGPVAAQSQRLFAGSGTMRSRCLARFCRGSANLIPDAVWPLCSAVPGKKKLPENGFVRKRLRGDTPTTRLPRRVGQPESCCHPDQPS